MLKPLIGLLLVLGLLMAPILPVHAVDLEQGSSLFELHCAGCHLNGGNIVRRNKTLKLKALERNGVDTVEAIANLVTQGKNNMSAYADRLTPEQIQTVAEFVLQRAQEGWARS